MWWNTRANIPTVDSTQSLKCHTADEKQRIEFVNKRMSEAFAEKKETK